MRTKLISQIVLSCSLVLLLVNAAWGAPPPAALTTYITPPAVAVGRDTNFSLTMGLLSPTSFSDQNIGAYFGHYYIPDDLEYISASSPNCSKLNGIKQVSCVLYNFNSSQTIPTTNAASYQLQFKLKNPVTFCGSSTTIKTINAGILSINPQTSFTPGLVNISINCGLLGSNSNVDLVTSYEITPIARVENSNPFPVRIKVYNADAAALSIDNVTARIQVPTVFEATSLATGCTIDANNLVTCSIGTLTATTPVFKDFQFRLKTSTTCTASAGNYTFSLSGSFSGTTRTEINSSNNTNIGAATLVACAPAPAYAVQFKVLSSSIVLANPTGGMGVGEAGRYSGTIDMRVQVTNTTSLDLSLFTFTYYYKRSTLEFQTPVVTNSCTAHTTLTSSPSISCDTRLLRPGESISQDFKVSILYPHRATSGVAPFNPVQLCADNAEVRPTAAQLVVLEQLTGRFDRPTTYLFKYKLDTSAVPGLDCTNNQYTQP